MTPAAPRAAALALAPPLLPPAAPVGVPEELPLLLEWGVVEEVCEAGLVVLPGEVVGRVAVETRVVETGVLDPLAGEVDPPPPTTEDDPPEEAPFKHELSVEA